MIWNSKLQSPPLTPLTITRILHRIQDTISDEQRHAHQGLGRPGLVVAFVYYSPWVMPGRSLKTVFTI